MNIQKHWLLLTLTASLFWGLRVVGTKVRVCLNSDWQLNGNDRDCVYRQVAMDYGLDADTSNMFALFGQVTLTAATAPSLSTDWTSLVAQRPVGVLVSVLAGAFSMLGAFCFNKAVHLYSTLRHCQPVNTVAALKPALYCSAVDSLFIICLKHWVAWPNGTCPFRNYYILHF